MDNQTTKATRVGAWAGTLILVAASAVVVAGAARLILLMFGH